MATCYRHPSRETGVSCSSCGRPICPDCMTPTPVGMRCPECSRDRTKVKTVRSGAATPVVTQALIAINVLVFFAETATGAPLGGINNPLTSGSVYLHGALFGPYITISHEYYRLLTSGFLHDGVLHIALNMFFLLIMGRILEPAIGHVNFAVVYFVSLLCGSAGALAFEPLALTVGASGACFGVLGALIIVAYYRGISIWASGLGLTLVINIVFTLSIAGISLGGHVGGTIGGMICGFLIVQLDEKRHMRAAALAACAGVAVLSVILAIAIAGGPGLTPNGLTLF